MSHTRLLVAVDIIDGEIVGMVADACDPGAASPPPAPPRSARLRFLRFPKANALRAVVAAIISTARVETRPCIS